MRRFLIIPYRIPQNPRLPLKLIQRPLRQYPVEILLQLIKPVNQFQPDVRFQHLQTVDLHRSIIKAHLLIRHIRKILLLPILGSLAPILFNIQLGNTLPGLRQRDPFLLRILHIESIDLPLDLVHHIIIDLPDTLPVLRFFGDIMLQLLQLPALPIFPAVHSHQLHPFSLSSRTHDA